MRCHGKDRTPDQGGKEGIGLGNEFFEVHIKTKINDMKLPGFPSHINGTGETLRQIRYHDSCSYKGTTDVHAHLHDIHPYDGLNAANQGVNQCYYRNGRNGKQIDIEVAPAGEGTAQP